jgi:hypothetical protein
MVRRLPLMLLIAALACAGAALTQAQDRKTAPTQPELGQDWRNLSDALDKLFEGLQKDANIKASKVCDDGTFLRRVYLDLLGRPPLPAEIEAFNPGKKDSQGRRGQAKREAIVETLLESPEHADYFSEWWTTTLIGRQADGNARRYLREYLQGTFAANTPWSETVHAMISVTGRTPEKPEVGYLMAFANQRPDIAGNTSKVFLGKQIQCAECHDHPYEDVTTDDFEGMEAFFRLSNSGATGEGADRYWFINETRPANQNEFNRRVRMRGKYKGPTYLGREDYSFDTTKGLRTSLADWLTSPDNKWFRDMTVNRYMAYFLGLGFVMPVDDFNDLNEPTFPVVMDVMGRDFAASGFDTRYLIKAICSSELYQREVDLNRTNRHDRKYYSRAFVRRLNPEQMHRSILHAVGIERLNTWTEVRDVPESQLTPDELTNKRVRDGVNNYKGYLGRLMRDVYGGDPEVRDLDDYDGTVLEALTLMNADLLGPAHIKNTVRVALSDFKTHDERVSYIFMTVLGRQPSKRDLYLLSGTFGRWGGADGPAYEDLFVALMNTTEFSTNH